MTDEQEVAAQTDASTTTPDDLVRILQEGVRVLTLNAEMMTDSLLLLVQGALSQARGMKDVVAAALAIPAEDVDKLLDAADKAMGVEQRLVKTDLTEKIVGVLTKLQDRPVILRLVAALL